MNFLLSLLFLILGIIFAVAGKDIVTVCALFIVYGVLQGVNELSLMRQEMERWEDDEDA